MAYDMSEAEVQAYLDQAQSPAERLEALRAMGRPPPAPFVGELGQGAQSLGPALPPATPQPVAAPGAPAVQAALSQQTGGLVPPPANPPPGLGGVPQPTTIPEVQVQAGPTTAPARGLGGVSRAPGIGRPQLHAAMADAAGAPSGGRPELLNPLGDIVKPHTPDELGVQREIEGEQYAGLQDQFNAQEYARDATRRAESAALDRQDAADAEQQRRFQEHQAALEQGEQRYRDMADQALAEPIDSERIWNSKSTGEKLLGSIAVFLGAIGQGVAGTPNLAWEKIQRDIDRDIEAQKANKALMRDRLAAEGSLLDMARQRFGDAATQDAAMREAAYRRIGAELDRFKEFAKAPERAASLDAMRLQVDQSIADQEQKRRQALDTATLQQRQIDRARAAAAAGPSPMQKLQQLAKQRKLQRGISEDERVIAGEVPAGDTTPIPLWGGARVPKEMGKDTLVFTQNMETVRAEIANYKRLGLTDVRAAQAAKDRMTLTLKKMGGTGLSSEEDMKKLGSSIPRPGVPGFDEKMRLWEQSLRDSETATRKSLGVGVNFAPKTEKR